jgi:hypothetical protein
MVVTHSHPIDDQHGDSSDNHNHSKNEICFYSAVHFDYFLITSELQILENINFISKDYIIRNEDYFHFKFSLHKTLRGPPAFQIS